ncbi:hypothetical protein ARALYDRAFT_314223 [Arabidopsis lyrata subsp. lyrata]|uniref:F-box domain-containing protein n=1 Tax=Arabidopsis lyrata subsp. lyrata TaxID=81972 RepID=D7KBW4_ARALL|nr:hypothetical protein ARALYDRAFT_314223 [Arabidopsis lyrata subsp. lyrata]
MEAQKEKRKFSKRKRTQSPKPTSSFPLDLISEILLRLPEKSVARFRCVSKLWLSITTRNVVVGLPSLLLCFTEYENLFVSSIPQHHHSLQDSNKSYSSSQPIDRYHLKFLLHNNFPLTESVHGLICFQESATPIVCNPSKRQCLTLPKPRKSWERLTVFLGYDPIEGKHKVMCLPFRRSSDVCRVLTLGPAQESWRTVKTKPTHCSDYHTSGRCIKGVVYYIAYVYGTDVWVVMSFDVRSEKFGMIQLPSDFHRDPLIACVRKTTETDGKMTLCILEDAEKHKWSNEISNTYLKVKGITHAGEFIYVPDVVRKSSYILFYDPVRNSFRRFELKGVIEEKSVLNNLFYRMLHAFPNHVESQMSL